MNFAEFGQIITGVTGVFLLCFAGYGVANLRYKVPGTWYFVALSMAGFVWCLGYAIEKAQFTSVGFFAAACLEYTGLAFLPTLWLMLALSWMEYRIARSVWFRSVVLGTSVVVLLAVWTNPWWGLWYSAILPTSRAGFAHFVPGPLYYPFFGILTSTFFFSSVVLILRRSTIPLFAKKAPIILVANLFPPSFALAFQLGFRPGGLDPTIFSLLPSVLVLAYGLFRHELIRILPIARETVVESLDQPVLVFDPDERLVDHNRASRDHLEEFVAYLAVHQAPQGEFELGKADNKRSYRYRRSAIQSTQKHWQGTVVVLTDVTEEKRLLTELSHQASHDALTGAANRRNFEEHALNEITRADRHGGTLALVLFDLDWFKSINDHYGHPSGDTVLKTIVSLLSPRLRPYDLLARLGGEEFAVLMPETNPVEAREAAERWRAAIEATPMDLEGGTTTLTASFGVATLDDLPVTLAPVARTRLDALLSLADRALYRAKEDGRNRVV